MGVGRMHLGRIMHARISRRIWKQKKKKKMNRWHTQTMERGHRKRREEKVYLSIWLDMIAYPPDTWAYEDPPSLEILSHQSIGPQVLLSSTFSLFSFFFLPSSIPTREYYFFSIYLSISSNGALSLQNNGPTHTLDMDYFVGNKNNNNNVRPP